MNNRALKTMKRVWIVNGFTLLEVLIVVALLMIIVSMAMPVATSVVLKKSIDTAESQFANALFLAQMHGKRIANDVFLCAGTQADHCQSQDWSSGMSLYRVDMETNTQMLLLIRSFDPLPSGVQLQLNQRRLQMSKHGSFVGGPLSVIVCHPDLDDYWSEINVAGFMIDIIQHHYDDQSVHCTVSGSL